MAARLRAARSALVAFAAVTVGISPAVMGCAPSSDADGRDTRAAVTSGPDGGPEDDRGGDGRQDGAGNRESRPDFGSGSGSAAKDSASPAGPSGTGRAPWCTTGALSLELRPLEPAAGNRYAALVFTNTSDGPCRTQGWPGLQLTGEGGEKIPTSVARDRSEPSVRLTVAPGGRVWSRLHWSAVPGDGDRADRPCPTPSGVRAIPPDRYDALATGWAAGAVCGGGRIAARPLAAGDGQGG